LYSVCNVLDKNCTQTELPRVLNGVRFMSVLESLSLYTVSQNFFGKIKPYQRVKTPLLYLLLSVMTEPVT